MYQSYLDSTGSSQNLLVERRILNALPYDLLEYLTLKSLDLSYTAS